MADDGERRDRRRAALTRQDAEGEIDDLGLVARQDIGLAELELIQSLALGNPGAAGRKPDALWTAPAPERRFRARADDAIGGEAAGGLEGAPGRARIRKRSA